MLEIKREIEGLQENSGKHFRIFPGYITHIRFPRYKNIVDGTNIEFSFPVTALVGTNGSGKTSVLNALYGAPARKSTGHYWFSTKVDPIEEGEGSPSRFIYGHYNSAYKGIVETRKARVRKTRDGRLDPNYWEPTKESPGDGMIEPSLKPGKIYTGRSKDRWNPVSRKVLYINFRKEISAFDKYFYFGKDPIVKASSRTGKVSPRRIINKMDQVRHDAEILSRVIESGDTSCMYRKHKVATENRLLEKEELDTISFILGRKYDEARWIRHRLFKGDGGLSIVFKTRNVKYSEAFAGSGEVAVTSCVVQVLRATKGTLVLLDEPEVSLHPGAQERLLSFLCNQARTKQIQIIFSTHSPHLITSLPDEAIKAFHQLEDGRYSVIPKTHPYAAFRRLGAVGGGQIRVIVEDRLAKEVVEQALLTFSDDSERGVFLVEYVSGGADSILTYQIPVLSETSAHTLILLDGDKKLLDQFVDPETIPTSENDTLDSRIREATGVGPKFTADGGNGRDNREKMISIKRRYLSWIRSNVDFIPTLCPEELVLRACGKQESTASTSQDHKNCLLRLTTELFGSKVSSQRVDEHGATLLATNRNNSAELTELAEKLRAYLASTRVRN